MSAFPSTESVAALTEPARPKLLTFVPPQPVLSPIPIVMPPGAIHTIRPVFVGNFCLWIQSDVYTLDAS
jgi:hypothetical protein